jgi:hypothetical protein
MSGAFEIISGTFNKDKEEDDLEEIVILTKSAMLNRIEIG